MDGMLVHGRSQQQVRNIFLTMNRNGREKAPEKGKNSFTEPLKFARSGAVFCSRTPVQLEELVFHCYSE
jgi:hypothetical protein